MDNPKPTTIEAAVAEYAKSENVSVEQARNELLRVGVSRWRALRKFHGSMRDRQKAG